MKLLPKGLQTEHYCYSSDKSLVQVTTDLKAIFKGTHLYSLECRGKFVDEYKFLLSKNDFMDVFNLNRVETLTRVEGKIEVQNDKTILNVLIKPYTGVFLVFFIPLVMGLVSLIFTLFNWQDITVGSLAVVIIMTFIVPIGIAFFGEVAKDNLRQKFVKVLELKQQNCP